jgi:MFS family permease
MDQQLFNLARKPAIAALTALPAKDPRVGAVAGNTTAVFMIGWAVGGILFGILGDRIGRARTIALTILAYSVFTGLSAFSQNVWDFTLYRFLTGLGVGGEFAVGVALVAEVMPARSRVAALGTLQACSALGNMTAALVSMALGRLEESGMVGESWRIMFLVGTAPALLCVPIMLKLKESDRWRAAKAAEKKARESDLAGLPDPAVGNDPEAPQGQKLGSIRELFGDPRWRRNTIVGMLLAFAGVVGLWGIGFFSFDLLRDVLEPKFRSEGFSPQAIDGKLTFWTGVQSLLQNGGAFFGVMAFTRWTPKIGRRPAFALSFLLAMAATAFTFWNLKTFSDIFWMIPIMGFCQLACFGGYAIYFPELFPTRLRSTGTSFCYNVGRLVAAVGPAALGLLTSQVFVNREDPMRWAGVTMCAVFLVGLFALPFAPETKGKPLPE